MSGSRRRVLVTGGAGFIGSHLVDRLLYRGHAVRVVDNLSTGHESNLAEVMDRIEFIQGDLTDASTCRRSVRDVHTIFHVAALPSVPRSLEDPWSSHDSNVNGTVRLLVACLASGVRRLIYSASSSAYGDTPTLPKVECSEPLPRSPYAAAKLAAEQYVLAFARAGLIEGVALRYFNVFGPRQDPNSPYAAVIPAFLRSAYEGRPTVVYGDGLQTRDFTYVSNVVDANLLAAQVGARRASGVVVNIGAGEHTSLLQVLEAIREVTGREVPCTHESRRLGDVRHSLAGLDRAREAIGYAPQVRLREGLKRTWDWFCRSYAPALDLAQTRLVASR